MRDGGDGTSTFNVSTAVAIVVASAGIAIAKHGNRSVSSRCGSADVYEALGLRIHADPTTVAKQIDAVGFGFLFAPHFHPAMKVVAPVRKELGVRTVFNTLGPLLNPAPVNKQIIGVCDRSLIPAMATALTAMGIEEALLVAGRDGIDEISVSAESDGVRLKRGDVHEFHTCPEELGIERRSAGSVRGGDAAHNADLIVQVLAGRRGAHRDIVALNAGAALWIGGVSQTLKDGVKEADALIATGKPLNMLEKLRAMN